MRTGENPYYLADRALELLNRKAVRRFNDAQSQAALLDFDELSVIRICKKLYADLENDNITVLLDLAQSVYEDALDEIEQNEEENEITEFWLLDFLESYNPITKYIYLHEVGRKRDYTAEGINSSKDKAKEFRRGLMYWSKMTSQACLDVSDAAQLKAYRDNGVKRVMWNTQRDGHVCDDCQMLDGKIFPIDNVPPKQHYGDRCFFTPVLED